MRTYRNQVLAGLLFITLVLIAVVVVTGAGALADRLENFPVWLFAPVLLLKGVNWTLRYLEWRILLGVIGVRTVCHKPDAPHPGAPTTIRERDSAVLWLSGLPLAVSPGKLAEVLKAVILKHLTGVEFSRGVPVVFMERLVDGLAVILLAAVALFFVAGSLDGSDLSAAYVRAVLAGTAAVLVAGIAVVQVRSLALWLLDRAGRLRGLRRIQAALRTLYDSTYELLKLRNLARPLLLGLGAHFSDCVGFFLLLTGLGLHPSWTLFGQAVFIDGFSVIMASLSAMPGGAGGRELTVGAALTAMVGLSKADAGTAAFLFSIFQAWAGVLLGLTVIALFRTVLFPPSLAGEIEAYQAARQA